MKKKSLIHYTYAVLLMLFVIILIFHVINKLNSKNISIPKCTDCNVVIITPTNIGAKHMSLYDYERLTTPNLDKFAKDSIVFTDAYSPISWSLPAVASLFTSQYPFTHGLMSRRVLDKNEVTLAEILKLYNYTTVAFTGGGDYKSIYGIDQGFDIFDDNDKSIIFTGSFNRSLEQATNWMENNSDKKFFMFVQGYDAHCPFDPPFEYRSFFENSYNGKINDSLCVRNIGLKSDMNGGINNYSVDAFYFVNMTISPAYSFLVPVNLSLTDINHLTSMYDSEIRYVDTMISNFLTEVSQSNISNKTILIIVGDHGDTFGEHGRLVRLGLARGIFYDDVINVPLIIKHPYISNGRKIDSLVQTIDVAPSILDFLNIPIPYGFQGISLLPLINRSKDSVHGYIFGGGIFGNEQSEIFPQITIHDYIRDKQWKLIYERSLEGNIFTFELYNIRNDPLEFKNLAKQKSKIASSLKNNLTDWEQSSVITKKLSNVFLNDEELKELRKAGYVG